MIFSHARVSEKEHTMEIIKEFVPRTWICEVSSDVATSGLSHIFFLLSIAQQDFPRLTAEDVEVVQREGALFKGFGIAFMMPAEVVPPCYRRVSDEVAI